MPNIKEIENKIIEEFEILDDWMERYGYIIELGKKLTAMPDSEKADVSLVRGCQSKVWIAINIKNDTIRIHADSNALIARGLVALVVRVFDNQKIEEVANISLEVFDKIGLTQFLTPSRSNGVMAMVSLIKSKAEEAIKIKSLAV